MSNDGSLIEDMDLILDENDVNLSVDIDIHSCAVLQNTSENVLVELLRYRDVWADEEIGKELCRRLSSVVSLLHAESTARIPGSLFCKGIFHDPSRHALGVVYDFPNTGMPVTLHQLLKASKGLYRPLLEQRFRLAADNCRCIYTFHQVGWLHRNLHSMNVLFFPRERTENAKWATEPRIMGFASSRENHSDAFTCGPDDVGQLRNYQHPEYLAHRDRYREEFDYYSVVMILLEIGLWNTLSNITESPRFQNTSDEKFCTEVIRSRVSQLGVAMRTSYSLTLTFFHTEANATGVYAGVVQEGFENRNDTWEETWGLTWLRGIQQTNDDGAVRFKTIFPGHYEDRAIHIHVLTHPHATPLLNNTIIDERASHVGQIYFNQDLIDRVEELAPYNTNNQPRTSNAEDEFLQGDLEAGGYPYLQYQLVGDKLEDGLVAWLSFGINATEDKVVDPITTYHSKPTKPTTACA